eukprot:GFUD01028193.1.p1 GENE.GFUD01028193.1~~GFUD01028193.1.p1  ORF type:complete len:307 (+),score=130.93 GFUD01028193.1:72-992(+)
MGVRVFISGHSGNKEIENSQMRIQMVLTSRDIEFDVVDISRPGMQEQRMFMREKGKKKEGQRNVIPPQIFNGEAHRGDYEDFDIANEDDDLEEFLGLPRRNPKAEPIKTGAVAVEVGRIAPGKLDIKQPAENKPKQEKQNNESTEISEAKNNVSEEDNMKNMKEATLVQGNAKGNKQDEHNHGEDLNGKNDNNTKAMAKEDILEANSETTDKIISEKVSSKNDSREVSTQKVGTDGDIINEVVLDAEKNNQNGKENLDDDSSDDSSDEEAAEYMPDGELMRKTSRGFKQLNNCKRFWKASLAIGTA